MSSLAKRRIMPQQPEPDSAAAARPEELRLLEAMLFASAEPLEYAGEFYRLEGSTLPVRPVGKASAKW